MSASNLIVLHVGAPGSGKTWRLKMRVAAAVRMGFCKSGARFVVADVKREWPTGPKDPPRGPLTNGARVPMGRLTGRVARLDAVLPPVTIARPSAGASADEVRAWFDSWCRFALDRRGVVVVAPEVWRYAREHERMSPALEELAHEHRHRDVGLWMDCQSYPEVSKELVRRAGAHLVHGTGAYEDLVRLQKMGGPHLRAAVVAAMESGPGHFVTFEASRPFPPYLLRGPSGAAVRAFGAPAGVPFDRVVATASPRQGKGFVVR